MKRDVIINHLERGGIFNHLTLWEFPFVTSVTGSKHFTRKKGRCVESTFQQLLAPATYLAVKFEQSLTRISLCDRMWHLVYLSSAAKMAVLEPLDLR